MRIRRTDMIVQPTRWALTALRTHFDAREVPMPTDDRVSLSVLSREAGDDHHNGIEPLLGVAMSPREEMCVRALEVLGRISPRLLEAYEGQLFCLFQVYLARRDANRTLLTPPIEAFLRHVPLWPERRHFAYGVPNAPTVAWFGEVRFFLERDDVLEDPDFPVLLELLERFPGLHGEAMHRLRSGNPPSLEAASRIASEYEPAVIPLVCHPDEEIAEAVREVASVWLDRIQLPTNDTELAEFRTHAELQSRLGRTKAGLIELVLNEHRPDLIPRALANRAAALLVDLAERRELEPIEITEPGHEFLVLAALVSDDGSISIDLLHALSTHMARGAFPPKVMAVLFEHAAVDEEQLERILRRIIEEGDRVIDQSRRLADPLFAHHRPAFRRIMMEGYRRTIGSPWLVDAVFMATPPEALHESLRFLLVNNAQTLPRLVRRWVEEHPDAGGRVDIDPRMIRRLKHDSHAGMALAGSLLEQLQTPVAEVTPLPRFAEEGDAALWFGT